MARPEIVQTTVTHAAGMEDLVGLYFSFRQDATDERLPVDLTLTFDAFSFHLEDTAYEVRIQSALVNLLVDNCSPDPTSLYNYHLTDGKIAENRTQKTTTHAELSGQASSSVDASAAGAASSKVGFGARAAGKRSTEMVSDVTRQNRIDLIRPAGQNRWRIGEPGSGDARRNDGCLSGSYFREHDDAPLCIMLVNDEERPVQITVAVSIPLSQLIVRPDTVSTKCQELIGDSLRAQSNQAVEAHNARVKELKSRVAGLAIGKHLKQQQKFEWCRPDEVVAALQSFVRTNRATTDEK